MGSSNVWQKTSTAWNGDPPYNHPATWSDLAHPAGLGPRAPVRADRVVGGGVQARALAQQVGVLLPAAGLGGPDDRGVHARRGQREEQRALDRGRGLALQEVVVE